jgi:hypothetical protein
LLTRFQQCIETLDAVKLLKKSFDTGSVNMKECFVTGIGLKTSLPAILRHSAREQSIAGQHFEARVSARGPAEFQSRAE